MSRSVRDGPAPVHDRLPWPRQVRRLGGQLGQRAAAGHHRPPARLRHHAGAVRPPGRRQRADADRPGEGLTAMTIETAVTPQPGEPSSPTPPPPPPPPGGGGVTGAAPPPPPPR